MNRRNLEKALCLIVGIVIFVVSIVVLQPIIQFMSIFAR